MFEFYIEYHYQRLLHFSTKEWAELLERQDPKDRGPLYGIPISVKDNLPLKVLFVLIIIQCSATLID